MNIYWELDYRRFVTGLSDGRIVHTLELPLGDIVPVRIYPVERSSIADPFVTQALDSGYEIVAAAKRTAGGGTYLMFSDAFTEVIDGPYTYYAGELDLGTSEIIAAVGSLNTLTVAFEITARKGGRNYYTTTARLRLINDVVDSADLPTAINDNVKLINGVLHIYNADQDKWFPVAVDGAQGQEHIDIGEGIDA